MGCGKSSSSADENRRRTTRIRKPQPWRHITPITRDQLNKMRNDFWDTAPIYGGRKVIWGVLRAATEATELETAQAIIDNAGIIVEDPDLSVCYDIRGGMYVLPLYVLSDPTNLIRDS